MLSAKKGSRNGEYGENLQGEEQRNNLLSKHRDLVHELNACQEQQSFKCISKQIPSQKKRILGGDQVTEDPSSSGQKDIVFVKSSANDTKVSIHTSLKDPCLSEGEGLIGTAYNCTGTTAHPPSTPHTCPAKAPLFLFLHLKKLDVLNEPISGPKTIKSILRTKSTFKVETIKGVIINEPSSTLAKDKKSSSASKVNSAPAGEALQAKKAEALKSTRAESSNANRSKTLTKRVRDVYVLNMKSSAQESCFFAKAYENLNWLWHKRLAHLNFKTINKLEKQNLVIGFPSLFYSKDKPCSSCENRKHHRASYKTKQTSSIKKCLHLLHMDLFGPLTPRSINHEKYTLVIVDKYSRNNILVNFFYIHNHKDHLGKFNEKADDGYLLGYSLVSKAFRVFNTRRQQTEETYHITFDESLDAIKFSKPSVDNINIVENKRYTPDEYLHPYEPSQRYLKGTLSLGLWYLKCLGFFDLKGYSDSDYAGCNMDKKSTSGACQLLGGKLVCWSAKKQQSVAMSSAEAEYVAAAGCCANILWMKSQLTDYDIIYEKVPIFCDNTSAIAISNNPVLHSRTKHIDIRYHFIRDHILKGDIELHFIPTQYQLADIFTKPLDEPTFKRLIVELDACFADFHVRYAVAELKNIQWELPAELQALPVLVSSVQKQLKTLDSLPSLLNNVTETLNRFATMVENASEAMTKDVPLAGQATVSPAEGEKNTKDAETNLKDELVDVLGTNVMTQYYNKKLLFDKYRDKMLKIKKSPKITNYEVLTKNGLITLKNIYREDGSEEVISNLKSSDLHLAEWREVKQACPDKSKKGWKPIYDLVKTRLDQLTQTEQELKIDLNKPLKEQDPFNELNELANKKRKRTSDYSRSTKKHKSSSTSKRRASALQVLKRLGSIFTSVYAAKLKRVVSLLEGLQGGKKIALCQKE
ncbi:retrovirus-related pol polyprotein from transposon TNT 1-94 [Tanacetum coccineum]